MGSHEGTEMYRDGSHESYDWAMKEAIGSNDGPEMDRKEQRGSRGGHGKSWGSHDGC